MPAGQFPRIWNALYHAGTEFGKRLVALRRAKKITQVRLAKAIGSTQRAISYYENEATYPPAAVVVAMAKVLGVTTDTLLGLSTARMPVGPDDDPKIRRTWNKFRKIVTLPEKDQRAVTRLVNSLVGARSRGHSRPAGAGQGG